MPVRQVLFVYLAEKNDIALQYRSGATESQTALCCADTVHRHTGYSVDSEAVLW